ncbi:hypothetical protein M9458_056059 [Cirrhinus mrigala]|uniref:Uncharacterized protein n=1 Tax=Cirrhinus mrigala TaxID=683832 RepID=A0ABD0MED2_CIRMR
MKVLRTGRRCSDVQLRWNQGAKRTAPKPEQLRIKVEQEGERNLTELKLWKDDVQLKDRKFVVQTQVKPGGAKGKRVPSEAEGVKTQVETDCSTDL